MSAESARSTGRRDIYILCCVALRGAELQESFGAHRQFGHQKAIRSNNFIHVVHTTQRFTARGLVKYTLR